MLKRLLARLFGRKQPVAVKAPMATRNHAMARRNIIVSTPTGRDDYLRDRFTEGRYMPIYVDATTIGDDHRREVLASCEPVNSHHHHSHSHHSHDTGSYDSGSSDSGSSTSSCDLGKEYMGIIRHPLLADGFDKLTEAARQRATETVGAFCIFDTPTERNRRRKMIRELSLIQLHAAGQLVEQQTIMGLFSTSEGIAVREGITAAISIISDMWADE